MRRVRCMQRDAIAVDRSGLADGLDCSSLRYLPKVDWPDWQAVRSFFGLMSGCCARARPCRPSQVVGSFHESDTSASRQDNQANELLGTVHKAAVHNRQVRYVRTTYNPRDTVGDPRSGTHADIKQF